MASIADPATPQQLVDIDTIIAAAGLAGLGLLSFVEGESAGGLCTLPYSEIADRCGISERHAIRLVKKLEAAGALVSEARTREDGRSLPNALVSARVTWVSPYTYRVTSRVTSATTRVTPMSPSPELSTVAGTLAHASARASPGKDNVVKSHVVVKSRSSSSSSSSGGVGGALALNGSYPFDAGKFAEKRAIAAAFDDDDDFVFKARTSFAKLHPELSSQWLQHILSEAHSKGVLDGLSKAERRRRLMAAYDKTAEALGDRTNPIKQPARYARKIVLTALSGDP